MESETEKKEMSDVTKSKKIPSVTYSLLYKSISIRVLINLNISLFGNSILFV